jgi:predicted O-methyltransferase YrrM
MAVHVPDESLDCVYIDCCHEYECVKKDLDAWMPKVKKGGIVAGHDVTNNMYGVRQAVDELTQRLKIKWTLIPEQGWDASFYFVKQ